MTHARDLGARGLGEVARAARWWQSAPVFAGPDTAGSSRARAALLARRAPHARWATLLAAACSMSAGCSMFAGEPPPPPCDYVHRLEVTPRDDVALLGRLIQLDPKPISAKWTRGSLGGAEKRVPGGGDWELVALLQYAEADANQLTDARSAEVVEVDLPATPWIAEALGTQLPAVDPRECLEPTIRVSGLGYDGGGFEQYFLKSQTFMKVSGSAYFVLWVATRPMTPQALAIEQAGLANQVGIPSTAGPTGIAPGTIKTPGVPSSGGPAPTTAPLR